MSIRMKLHVGIIGGLSICLVMMGLILVWVWKESSSSIARAQHFGDVVQAVFELDSVTNEYFLYREERPREQWFARYDSLGKILARSEVNGPDEQLRLDLIDQGYQDVRPLFERLVDEVERSQSDESGIDGSVDIEQRLIGQIAQKSQTMVENAFLLSEASTDSVHRVQLLGTITLASVGGFIIILLVLINVRISNSIVMQIADLSEAATAIAAGNLSRRVPAHSKDELGQLAVTFNLMTEKLQTSKVQIEDIWEFRQAIFSTALVGILAYDAGGDCVLANKAAASITGGTQEQILQQNFHEIESWKGSGLLEAAQLTLSGGGDRRVEALITSAFGKDVWLDCLFSPFASEGNPHLLLMVDDITDRKRAEQQLQAHAAMLEQSNRDLQEFAYVASHDLQEPTRKILAFGDRLKANFAESLDPEAEDYLNRMQSASRRMQTLINDLLTLSRVTTSGQSFIEVDLNQIAQDVISDLEVQIQETGGEVMVSELPCIEADPSQMHQLLQNLVSNALKFHHVDRHPGVRISADTFVDDESVPYLAQGGQERCRIRIEDNGIGFKMEYLERIFQPFQRLQGREKYEGTGMGLAIVRRIVERHGGEITAVSDPGQGATFIVTLPIIQEERRRIS